MSKSRTTPVGVASSGYEPTNSARARSAGEGAAEPPQAARSKIDERTATSYNEDSFRGIIVRVRWLAIVVMLGCYRSGPTAAPVVEAPRAATTEPAPAQACTRYSALVARLDECPQLPEEDRQRLVQIDTDLGAAQSESGMEGATPYDSERGCEEASAILVKVAASICGWTSP